jgi:hypothetical protein
MYSLFDFQHGASFTMMLFTTAFFPFPFHIPSLPLHVSRATSWDTTYGLPLAQRMTSVIAFLIIGTGVT